MKNQKKLIKNKILYFLILLFLPYNFVLGKEKFELKYIPYANMYQNYTYGSALVGDPLELDEEMNMEKCENFLYEFENELFKSSKERYLKAKERRKVDNLGYPEPKKIEKSDIGKHYFCWPSDGIDKEVSFFRQNNYISPETKDKIFPLGERKYSDEPKPKMELLESDKK